MWRDRLLQIDGHATHVAASAEEGLVAAAKADLDVVVTDYRLPGITGAAFVKEFRGIHADVYAIVISAYTDDRTIQEARDAGATFLPKPLDFQLLSRLVRECHT